MKHLQDLSVLCNCQIQSRRIRVCVPLCGECAVSNVSGEAGSGGNVSVSSGRPSQLM